MRQLDALCERHVVDVVVVYPKQGRSAQMHVVKKEVVYHQPPPPPEFPLDQPPPPPP
ncbi:hypothetical protein AG1IA_02557 [Rhizoctonia solani AG-1 IA]|uniref:Uncharacterized protein n=1 Tax=Thanatephorus cucumeris (strain AG1-IA) TaxID=983506 RepID=L8WZA5_THACA|nr:hypothetical protein AG1IA_02557 [Rhizoctonia solani AG-1 IA]